jgi:hypothetical protein
MPLVLSSSLSRACVVEEASQIAMVSEGLGVALVPRMGPGSVPATVRA